MYIYSSYLQYLFARIPPLQLFYFLDIMQLYVRNTELECIFWIMKAMLRNQIM